MKYYITIFLFLTGLVFSANAQLPQYHAQVFGEEYGFGDGVIFDIFEDREQFIWATTPTSLQRFDGRNVHKYPFDEYITHAICDADGRIWVLTGPGYGIYRNRTDWKGFERIKFDSSGDVRLRGIFQMENGPVHVITNKGLYAWRNDIEAFQLLSVDFPGAGGRHNINRIDTCNGTLIYPVSDGICAYNMETGQKRIVPLKGRVDWFYELGYL